MKHFNIFFARILLASAIILSASHANAQSYVISPDDTIQYSGALEDLQTLIINQVNNSNDTLSLKWQKISAFVPQNWEATICDNSMCFTSLVDSGMMVPVNPGDYGFLLLHITPHITTGIAIIRYGVWDSRFPAAIDTLTYIMNVDSVSGVIEANAPHSIITFPNPENTSIHIQSDFKSGFEYSIADLSGKEVISGVLISNSGYISTDELSSGNYTLSIFNQSAFILSKNISIQHP